VYKRQADGGADEGVDLQFTPFGAQRTHEVKQHRLWNHGNLTWLGLFLFPVRTWGKVREVFDAFPSIGDGIVWNGVLRSGWGRKNVWDRDTSRRSGVRWRCRQRRQVLPLTSG
jgi:hypothetical protein